MNNKIEIATTGLVSQVILEDLGNLVLNHPINEEVQAYITLERLVSLPSITRELGLGSITITVGNEIIDANTNLEGLNLVYLLNNIENLNSLGNLNFKGFWDSDINIPSLVNGIGVKGDYYKVNVAGTNLGFDWTIGDLALYDGSVWGQIQGGTSDVVSVAGRTGVITLASSDISGLAPSATIDTTDATNITTGILNINNGGTGSNNSTDALINLGAYPNNNPNNYTSNLGTVTDVLGAGPILSSGGVTPTISINNATDLVSGAMSPEDKIKLDAITGTNSGDLTLITGGYNYLTLTNQALSLGPIAQSEVTDLISTLNGKQSTLVSGANIKTINNTSLLDSGDITITGITNFTETLHTAAPNATVNAVRLLVNVPTTNGGLVLSPKGTGYISAQLPDNTALGGNIRGAGAVDLQLSRTGSDRVASGTNSFAAGSNCEASGLNSIALGSACTASFSTSVAIGNNNNSTSGGAISIGEFCTASASNSIALGSLCTASGTRAIAYGFQSTTFNRSHVAVYSSGQESTIGDSQQVSIIYRNRTTDETQTVLTANSTTVASTANIYSLQNFQGCTAQVIVNAILKGSSGTENKSWVFTIRAYRGANAATTTVNIIQVLIDGTVGASSWLSTIQANTSIGGWEVVVTGAPSSLIQWSAAVISVENIYS